MGEIGKKQWYDGLLYGLFFDPFEASKRKIISDFIPENASVLDVCCGTGRLSIELAQKCKFVTGIDFSESMISLCQKNKAKSGLNNVEFVFGDASRLDRHVNEKFDYAVISLALHEMERMERMRTLGSMIQVADNIVISDHTAPQPRNLTGFLNHQMELFIGGRATFAYYMDFVKSGGVRGVLKDLGLALRGEAFDGSGSRHVVCASVKK